MPGMPAALPRLGGWMFALLAGLAALGVAIAAAAVSTPLAFALAFALATVALVVWTREPRRALIVAVFVLAPLDVSKAVMAPSGPFYSPGLYLSPAHIVVVLLLVLWLGHRMLFERKPPPFTRLDGLVLLFLAIIWASAIGSAQGAVALATAAAYTLAVVAFYTVSHALRDGTDLRLAVAASAAVLLLEGLHVAAQIATGSVLPLPGAKSLLPAFALNFDAGGASFMRPTGFQGHPNTLGHHMVILLPAALALVLMGKRWLGTRTLLAALAVLATSAVVLLLTLSRGGWASGLLGALLVVAVYAKRGVLSRRQLAGFALAAAAAVAVLLLAYPQVLLRLTSPDGRSVESRVMLTDQALAMVRANPLTGVGYGNYNRAAFEYVGPLFATVSADFQKQLRTLVVHNGYLLLAAELGIPAMLLFMYLMWRFVRLPWSVSQWRDPGAYALAVGLAGAMAAQALYWSSDNYYADIRVFLMWLSAGLLRALVRVSQECSTPAATTGPSGEAADGANRQARVAA